MTDKTPDVDLSGSDRLAGPPALRRPIRGRMVAGVAAGVARYLDIDPTLVRIALVVLTFFGGSGMLLYAAGWLFIPDDMADSSIGEHWLDHLTGPAS